MLLYVTCIIAFMCLLGGGICCFVIVAFTTVQDVSSLCSLAS